MEDLDLQTHTTKLYRPFELLSWYPNRDKTTIILSTERYSSEFERIIEPKHEISVKGSRKVVSWKPIGELEVEIRTIKESESLRYNIRHNMSLEADHNYFTLSDEKLMKKLAKKLSKSESSTSSIHLDQELHEEFQEMGIDDDIEENNSEWQTDNEEEIE